MALSAATAAPRKEPGKEPWRDPAVEPYIRIDKVTKKFGDFVAVDEVSLSIYRGEIFCLLGGSGCGKTTLLRMLAGFEAPTAGRIFIDGVDMAGVPPYNRPVNMMFQSYALFPHMTVEQNVSFGLRQESLPRAEIAQRVADMLGIVKLKGYEQRKPHQLSGGQRQRVLIARALVQDAQVLLLDEPLSGVDAPSAARIEGVLRELRDEGRALLVATHDVEQARRFERVLCLHRRQVAFGAPAEVLRGSVLQETYGDELVVLEGGRPAVNVGHHDHHH